MIMKLNDKRDYCKNKNVIYYKNLIYDFIMTFADLGVEIVLVNAN